MKRKNRPKENSKIYKIQSLGTESQKEAIENVIKNIPYDKKEMLSIDFVEILNSLERVIENNLSSLLNKKINIKISVGIRPGDLEIEFTPSTEIPEYLRKETKKFVGLFVRFYRESRLNPLVILGTILNCKIKFDIEGNMVNENVCFSNPLLTMLGDMK